MRREGGGGEGGRLTLQHHLQGGLQFRHGPKRCISGCKRKENGATLLQLLHTRTLPRIYLLALAFGSIPFQLSTSPPSHILQQTTRTHTPQTNGERERERERAPTEQVIKAEVSNQLLSGHSSLTAGTLVPACSQNFNMRYMPRPLPRPHAPLTVC